MCDDTELLREYARNRSESAFTELVRRHVNLVYSAATRYANGDAVMAEDITQLAFTELARKADEVCQHPALAGWLYTCVRHVASNLKRTEQRRLQREQEALAMNESNASNDEEAIWRQVRPVLDDAMHELDEKDRTVVVLRFFEHRSLREVGETVGLNENAARMRVERAMEKLRDLLARRGITSTASGLASALAAGAIFTAPSGMASAVAASALAGAASTATTTFTIIKIMSMTKLKIALAGTLLVAGVAVPVWQQGRIEKLTTDSVRLQDQVTEMLKLREEANKPQAAAPSSATASAEVQGLREANDKLQKEVLQLRGRVSAATTATLKAQTQAAAAENGKETNAMSAGLSGMMRGILEQQFMGKLPLMKTKLKLTDQQEEAVRDIMRKQVDQAVEASQKMLAGKMTKDEMANTQKTTGNPEEQIKALLTPEQLPLYTAYKTEENTSNASLVANAELLQMQQNSLVLTQEQQDQAYKALYEHTFKQFTGKLAENMPKDGDPNKAMQWTVDQKVKALESILNEDQLKKYREFQENQAKMISSMMPKDDKKGQ
jgi:RNA polymerase sigma factor (sigma-70 family)